MSDFSQILKNIKSELSSQFLENEIEVGGHMYKLRLLNDEEMGWSFSNVKVNSELGLAISVRRTTLAIGIRAIDGGEPVDLFDGMIKELSDEKLASLHVENDDNMQFIYAGMMQEYLKGLPSDHIDAIYDGWKELEKARAEAQRELKN